jgi:hypothetical protein
MNNDEFQYEDIFGPAMDDLKDIWSQVSYSGQKVQITNVKSWEPDSTETFDDYKNVHEFLMSSKNSSDTSAEGYRKEMKFFLEHCERKKYFLRFYICKKNDCQCREDKYDSSKPLELLEKHCPDNLFFEPTSYFKDQSVSARIQNGRHFPTFHDKINDSIFFDSYNI